MPKTYLFHDYETFGLNTKKTRVSQFAAIRTDENLNIIQGEEFNYFSLPSADFIPSPEACLVTGITPFSIVNSNVDYLSDYELFSKIHDLFNKEGTCSLGYNSIQFDDEISRNGFYRNLLPVYSREFSNNCSRFDVLNMLREYAFLYPEDINIPVNDEGQKVFKLDQLAPLNGFSEDSYHDAFTDVKATIYMAKLMKEKRPDYWDFRINLHTKKPMLSYINNNRQAIFLYTSSMNGGDSDFVEPILITAHSYPDQNSFIGVKLSDLDGLYEILETPLEEIKNRTFMNNEELSENNLDRLPFIKFAANKAPILMTLNDVMSLGIDKINKPLTDINNNLNFATKNFEQLRKSSMAAYKNEGFDNNLKNEDLKIYDGFMDRSDEFKAREFHSDVKNNNFSKYILEDIFVGEKVNKLARKIIYRNFEDKIINDELLSPYFLKYFENSFASLKSNGFSNEHTYSQEELSDENYFKNEKMVEYTFGELRDIIPKIEQECQSEPNKIKILNDFKQSLNLLLEKNKKYKSLFSYKDQSKENKKESSLKLS